MGILGCAALVVLLFSSMPVAFAMALVGLVGFGLIRHDCGSAMSMASHDVYAQFASTDLTVIPLFVLMGQIAFHSGISRRLFHTAYCWLGPLPGGLAMATTGACTAFGAICGSGPATTATMALVALPEMKRYKYDIQMSAGIVASGGTLGMMIPPSVVFICYGIMTQQSIGKLFISGILPGLMTAFLFCLFIYVMCRRKPERGPAAPPMSWHTRLASLAGVAETLVLFVVVMGGMLLGYFTPTEGAAVGAAATIGIAAFRRQISWKVLVQSLQETARTTCMVIMIVAGAVVFGRFLAVSQITTGLATWLAGLPLPGWVILSFIIIFYIIGGCFVDALALLMLTVPIFYPVVVGLEYDLIWFGVIIVLVTQIGVVTPPVGICAYVVNGIDRSIPLETVFKGCLPFIVAMVLATALLLAFPAIATWLPGLVQ
jgi:C4-dicarboxylate transporter, DctM subunit